VVKNVEVQKQEEQEEQENTSQEGERGRTDSERLRLLGSFKKINFQSRMKIPTDFSFWIVFFIVFLATTVVVTAIKASIYSKYGIPVYSAYPVYPVRV
jgi:hypothetical protein